MKYSDEFYDHFSDLIQDENQLFPKSKEALNEKIALCNKALNMAAEENLKPRERIDRTFKMTDKIKNKFDKRDELNNDNKFREAIKLTKEIRKDIRRARNEQKIEELKENLWLDIKSIKKGIN